MKEFFLFSQATLRGTRDSGSYLDSFREFYNKAIHRQGETFYRSSGLLRIYRSLKDAGSVKDIQKISVEHFGFHISFSSFKQRHVFRSHRSTLCRRTLKTEISP